MIQLCTDGKYFPLAGSVNIGKILHSYGANVTALDENGRTPLHIAAASGNFISGDDFIYRLHIVKCYAFSYFF